MLIVITIALGLALAVTEVRRRVATTILNQQANRADKFFACWQVESTKAAEARRHAADAEAALLGLTARVQQQDRELQAERERYARLQERCRAFASEVYQ